MNEKLHNVSKLDNLQHPSGHNEQRVPNYLAIICLASCMKSAFGHAARITWTN